jgi:hypothetical protein
VRPADRFRRGDAEIAGKFASVNGQRIEAEILEIVIGPNGRLVVDGGERGYKTYYGSVQLDP